MINHSLLFSITTFFLSRLIILASILESSDRRPPVLPLLEEWYAGGSLTTPKALFLIVTLTLSFLIGKMLGLSLLQNILLSDQHVGLAAQLAHS